MIIEMQTYTLKTRSVGAAIKMFEDALPARTALSPLAAFWRSEIGVLNQAILIWPYASAEERDKMRASEAKIGGWPPQLRDHVLDESTRIWTPAPFSPALTPRWIGDATPANWNAWFAPCGLRPAPRRRWAVKP